MVFPSKSLPLLLCAAAALAWGAPGASAAFAAPAAHHGALRPSLVHPLAMRPRLDASGLFYDFTGDPDGNDPQAGLVDAGGTLYGTTYVGGANNLGAVFAIGPSGESIVHSFAGADGAYPEASLIDVNGTLYGTTSAGTGASSYGVVFAIGPSGFSTVYRFQGSPDGGGPAADVAYGDGALYGTTSGGGAYGYGTVFKIPLTGSQAGMEAVLYAFKGTANGQTDGQRPLAGVVYHDGTVYGTTYQGGAHGEGTIFSVSSTGVERVLHAFGATSRDGFYPQADLMLYKKTLFGTTSNGGGQTSPAVRARRAAAPSSESRSRASTRRSIRSIPDRARAMDTDRSVVWST